MMEDFKRRFMISAIVTNHFLSIHKHFLHWGFFCAFISLGVLGEATMWEAVFADVGVALIAVFNAMRILR